MNYKFKRIFRTILYKVFNQAIIFLIFIFFGSGVIAIYAYPFFAINKPLQGDIMVIEGWLRGEELRSALQIYRTGKYNQIVVTGGTFAYNTAETLTSKWQIDPDLIKVVVRDMPNGQFERDRTFNSALGLRHWLLETNQRGKTVDIVTRGHHARRSFILFKTALDGVAKVGVIAVPPYNYDPDYWYDSSAGFRSVIGEIIAYIYVKLIFAPEFPKNREQSHFERYDFENSFDDHTKISSF